MIWRTLIVIFGLFLVWQLCVVFFQLPSFLLPSPISVIKVIIQNPMLLVTQAWPTICETLMGFVIATLWGVMVAIGMRLSRGLRFWVLPVLLLSQAIPTFAIAPFFVIWFGYGMSSKVAITIFALFFPITISFYDGLRRVKEDWLQLSKTMQAKRLRLLWFVEIPAALPGLGSGLRVSAAWAPMAAVIGEWVGSSKGLGFLMLNANSRADTALMFAALFVLVVFAMCLYFVIDNALKYWIFWENK